ncbi:hypothetical protein D3C73_1140490 [compost metagenome]
MLNVCHRFFADDNRIKNSCQISANKCNVSCVHSYICACSNGNTHISCHKRRCIIDSVSDHDDLFTSTLQPLNLCDFPFWKYFSHEKIDTCLFGYRPCSTFVITCEQDNMESKLLQTRSYLSCILLNGVRNSQKSGILSINSNEHNRFTFIFHCGCNNLPE